MFTVVLGIMTDSVISLGTGLEWVIIFILFFSLNPWHKKYTTIKRKDDHLFSWFSQLFRLLFSPSSLKMNEIVSYHWNVSYQLIFHLSNSLDLLGHTFCNHIFPVLRYFRICHDQLTWKLYLQFVLTNLHCLLIINKRYFCQLEF